MYRLLNQSKNDSKGIASLNKNGKLYIENQDVEDIYSFTVNAINIFIVYNENLNTKDEWKCECFHYARSNFLCYSLKESKFSFYFIVYTPVRACGVITNVSKQNMTAIASHSVINM